MQCWDERKYTAKIKLVMQLKRDAVKYVRDRIKSQYPRGTECRICGTEEDLNFHHFNSVAELWNAWTKRNKVKIKCVDDILEHRDIFLEEYRNEMLNECATLCKSHHELLHKLYGKNPALHTAEKQARWVERKRVKFLAQ